MIMGKPNSAEEVKDTEIYMIKKGVRVNPSHLIRSKLTMVKSRNMGRSDPTGTIKEKHN